MAINRILRGQPLLAARRYDPFALQKRAALSKSLVGVAAMAADMEGLLQEAEDMFAQGGGPGLISKVDFYTVVQVRGRGGGGRRYPNHRPCLSLPLLPRP